MTRGTEQHSPILIGSTGNNAHPQELKSGRGVLAVKKRSNLVSTRERSAFPSQPCRLGGVGGGLHFLFGDLSNGLRQDLVPSRRRKLAFTGRADLPPCAAHERPADGGAEPAAVGPAHGSDGAAIAEPDARAERDADSAPHGLCGADPQPYAAADGGPHDYLRRRQ